MRWIDLENPVFPLYNNVFKSPYWLELKALGQGSGDGDAAVPRRRRNGGDAA